MDELKIKTGFLCNNNCRFCLYKTKGERSNKSRQKIEEELKAGRNFKKVVFSGGEPTIRKDISEIISFAKKKGFKEIEIKSNGRMFAYQDFCEELIKRGANRFSFYLLGHIKELHDWLTCIPGSFEQIVKGIKNLKALGQKVNCEVIITKSNYPHLLEILDFGLKLKIDHFQFIFPKPVGMALENFDSLIPRFFLIVSYLKEAVKKGVKAKKIIEIKNIPACFLKGYEKYMVEGSSSGKTKAKDCLKCRYFKSCEGIFEEYIKHFGEKEICSMKK